MKADKREVELIITARLRNAICQLNLVNRCATACSLQTRRCGS